jgi:tRNA threonylcarbamoyladenosine biosynthesis protein TsaB
MPNLLAIDTSHDTCSIGLILQERSFLREQLAYKKHSNLVLQMLDELLLEAAITLCDINVLSFVRGPGSFTGLRLAATLVQGLAFTYNLPMVGISSLQVLAQLAYRSFGYREVLTIMDARLGQIYIGLFRLDLHGIMQPCMNEQLTTIAALPSLLESEQAQLWHAIGNGVKVHEALLREQLPYLVIDERELQPHILYVLAIAKSIYALEGGNTSLEQCIPLYMKPGLWQTIKD